jgi:hypothetical protein
MPENRLTPSNSGFGARIYSMRQGACNDSMAKH